MRLGNMQGIQVPKAVARRRQVQDEGLQAPSQPQPQCLAAKDVRLQLDHDANLS